MAGWGTLLALIGQWLFGFGVFFWPRKTGAFGGEIRVGAVSDFEVGEVERIQEGKCFLSCVPEGFLALWWKCPHLGCTVPWRPEFSFVDPATNAETRGWFRCPCHGSTYNYAGVRVFGPAPRSMDRMEVTISGGRISVNTGRITKGTPDNADFAVEG
jgi:cytochrome b6-f complex iron-sulfur subunit